MIRRWSENPNGPQGQEVSRAEVSIEEASERLRHTGMLIAWPMTQRDASSLIDVEN